MIFCCMLTAINVDNPIQINNPATIFTHDLYSGKVINYEDKIIALNFYSIEEFSIQPNGHLEKIGHFEIGRMVTNLSINEDRLYFIEFSTTYPKLHIYDLNHSPMEHITTIDLIISQAPSEVFFSTKHIMVSDYNRRRTILLNKITFEIDGYVEGLYGGYIGIIGQTLINFHFRTSDGYMVVMFSNIDDDYNIVDISEIITPGFKAPINDVQYLEHNVIISTENGFLNIDYSDMNNPFVFSHIFQELGFNAAHYANNRIYAYDAYGNLKVYNQNTNGVLTQLFLDNIGLEFGNRNLYYVEPYLYVNSSYNLRVYDTANDFQIVDRYGSFGFYPSICYTDDNIYYIDKSYETNMHKVYSVLDNSLICTISYPLIDYHFGPGYFGIVGNRLYILLAENDSRYFNIYKIENQQTILLKSIYVSPTINTAFSMISDRVIFSTAIPFEQYVYKLVDDDLEFITTFDGIIQNYESTLPKDFLLNRQGNKLLVRDINDVRNILFETTLSPIVGQGPMHYFNENHFIFTNNDTRINYVFSLNIADETVDLIGQFYCGERITIFNEIISAPSDFHGITDFYTIINNRLVHLQSESFKRHITLSYLFPELGKMVHIGSAGIVTYDIDYTKSNTDKPVFSASELIYNYPNPFNPFTTIYYDIVTAGDVAINIFNLRGQRVKTLVDEYHQIGKYNVDWNGTDDNGRKVSSGVYFYQMRVGDFVQTRRMVMLK